MLARFGRLKDKMRPLVPLFRHFTAEEAQALAEAAVKNDQIWNARQCRNEYLPEFIRVQGRNSSPRHCMLSSIRSQYSFKRVIRQ